jgi:DNA-directed RNA polymerase specialized sigma24 family protein
MKAPSPLGRKALDELTETEWTSLWKRLRFFTYKNFAHKVKGRVNLDEVILEAIGDAYVGKRNLPPGVNLTAFLCETIRSKISHLLRKDKGRVSIEELEAAEQLTSSARPFKRAVEGGWTEEGYERVAYRELCERLRKAAHPDVRLIQLAELLFATPDLKPSEIAVRTNQPVENVSNLLRRLGRRARKLR